MALAELGCASTNLSKTATQFSEFARNETIGRAQNRYDFVAFTL